MHTSSLSGFEIDLLNKFIHTQTFDELTDLQAAMYEQLIADKETLISSDITNGQDFNSFGSQTIDSITSFLVGHEFFHAREGGVYFLTAKGKHLKAQQTLQKYLVWEKEQDSVLLEEMHTIQKQGYLEREQPTREELKHPVIDAERKSNFIYYILIIIAIVLFCVIGKYHKFN